MATQPINRSKKIIYECLIWGVSLWMGGITTLVLALYVTRVVNYSYLAKISIIIYGVFTLTITFNSLLLKFLDNLKTQNRFVLFSCLMVVVFIIFILWFFGKIPISMPAISQSWLGGKKELIVRAANLFMTVIIFPFLLFLMAVELWALFHLNHLHCYHRLFVATLVGLSLLPLCNNLDISDLERGLWRNGWFLDIYAKPRYYLGDRMFILSIIGKDDWLIYTGENSLDDYQNTIPFSQSELADIQRKLDQLNNLLRSKGIKLLVFVPPNKNTIYPEYMPPQIPVLGSQSRLDQLLAYQQQHGEFKVMDLRPALLNARKEHQVYYAADTHWNSYGAFIAYQEVFRELQKDFPNLKPHTLEEYRYVPGPGRFCAIPDIPIYEHFDIPEESFGLEPVFRREIKEQVQWEKKDASFSNGFAPLVVTTTQSDLSLPRLLMFRDSFANDLTPFFSDHFSVAVYLWAVPINKSYYKSVKPDIVILEYAERFLDYLLKIPG